MSKKIGQEPAFACECMSSNGNGGHIQEGISKRFYAACAAMQGLLSGMSDYNLDSKCKYRDRIATTAYIIADELLKQENE